MSEKEVEVEYLPTIGEAESIKTRKQGRRHNQYEENELENIRAGLYQSNGKKKWKKAFKPQEFQAICGRILRFEHATEIDKEIVRSYLDGNKDHVGTIYRINSKYTKKYFKEYYLTNKERVKCL